MLKYLFPIILICFSSTAQFEQASQTVGDITRTENARFITYIKAESDGRLVCTKDKIYNGYGCHFYPEHGADYPLSDANAKIEFSKLDKEFYKQGKEEID